MGTLLTESWGGVIGAPWIQIVTALAAALCGAFIGGERARHEKPAGVRTMMLVCVGSAAFTMVSFVFSTTTGDSGRVAAQIVTGIGFLGAGVILRGRGGITGMTTAATIWTTAAIGIVLGTGHIPAGIGLTLLVRGVLSGVRFLEKRTLEALPPLTIDLVYEARRGKTHAQMASAFDDFGVDLPPEEEPPGAEAGGEEQGADAVRALRIELRLQQGHSRELLGQIAALDAVRALRVRRLGGKAVAASGSGPGTIG